MQAETVAEGAVGVQVRKEVAVEGVLELEVAGGEGDEAG